MSNDHFVVICSNECVDKSNNNCKTDNNSYSRTKHYNGYHGDSMSAQWYGT